MKLSLWHYIVQYLREVFTPRRRERPNLSEQERIERSAKRVERFCFTAPLPIFFGSFLLSIVLLYFSPWWLLLIPFAGGISWLIYRFTWFYDRAVGLR